MFASAALTSVNNSNNEGVTVSHCKFPHRMSTAVTFITVYSTLVYLLETCEINNVIERVKSAYLVQQNVSGQSLLTLINQTSAVSNTIRFTAEETRLIYV